jgi:nucleoside-diphosphate-sugar epimerase
MAMATGGILIIGSEGQVGSELVEALRSHYRPSRVIAADLKSPESVEGHEGPYEQLDVLDKDHIERIIQKNQVTEVYNLAALLSASAEAKPMMGWSLNMNGLLNTLQLAKDTGIKRVFWPSSIAVFGPTTPKTATPQHTVMDPNTVYGISKLAGERWCQYFHNQYGIDTRSIRYPGLISYKTEPGGGTTDYAVDIFHQALSTSTYTSFLKPDTYLPMLYMPDAIRGTVELMHADASRLSLHSSYNLGGLSLAPETLADTIQQQVPDFSIQYEPDFRQAIADTWPSSINDSIARADWGWKPAYSLNGMVMDMLKQLRAQKDSSKA